MVNGLRSKVSSKSVEETIVEVAPTRVVTGLTIEAKNLLASSMSERELKLLHSQKVTFNLVAKVIN